MRWVDFRPRHLTTRTGVCHVERGYWVCPACGTGCAPDDARWGLPAGRVSPGVKEGVALLGQALPFAQAHDLYARLVGVEVGTNSTEDWTEAVGAAYTPPVPTPYEPGPRADVLFVLADAGMLHTREAGWKERKVFAAWRRVEGVDQPVRYAVGAGAWEDQTARVAALARREGSRLATERVCIADGAAAIWKLYTRLWPEAFQLLDWFHLMEHLETVVSLVPEGATWRTTQQTALLQQSYRPVVRALLALVRAGTTVAVRAVAHACLHYVWAHRTRLNYPEAQRRGYPIGSGRIESAVKQVLQQRCKQTGMRWKAAHLDKMLAARCAYLNGDWDLACQQTRQAA
ncbi:MAG: ISKra4 family transposase [Armatimonadota bacterium]